MGQKTNPNIFRLGINKTWKTEFFEKKNRELPLYIFKDLDIQNYLKRFLEIQGIYLHDYKQHHNSSTLYLYVSYFISPEFVHKEKNAINKSLLIFSSHKKKKLLKKIKNSCDISNESTENANIEQFSINSSSKKLYEIKRYLNKNTKKSKEDLISHSHEFLISKTQGSLIQFLKVLNLFTNKNFEIITHWCCLNKNFNFLKQFREKKFILFQKFRRAPFLKTGLELMFHVVSNKNSASLLTSFIGMHLKKIKRHKFFLAFLKQTLKVLMSSDLSEVRGIKIAVKGRLNGAARARHRVITLGKTPIHSLKAKIDYYQTSIHNSNGSYGIKVWIIEKN